jgi:lipoyl(octanoyl) transferase
MDPNPNQFHSNDGDLVLQAYLLGALDFDDALRLQRYLLYQVRGDHRLAGLVMCEHPPLITVGRRGSRAHILADPVSLQTRGLPVRWVNHGGACLLHLPGQLAIYPILSLDYLGLDVQAYLARLHAVLLTLLGEFGLDAEARPEQSGIWVGSRPIACVGVAVRDWVTYFGCFLNVQPDLEPFRQVHCGGAGEPPMTSLERELREPIRPALIRERFLDHFRAHFPCERTSLFFHPPAVPGATDPRGVVRPRA